MVGRPFLCSGSGRETLPEVRKCRETLPEVQKWSGDPPQVWKWLGDPPQVWKWKGDPPKSPEVVVRHSGRIGCGRETTWEVQK